MISKLELPPNVVAMLIREKNIIFSDLDLRSDHQLRSTDRLFYVACRGPEKLYGSFHFPLAVPIEDLCALKKGLLQSSCSPLNT